MTVTEIVTPAVPDPGTADWWVARLLPRLAAQADAADWLDTYYRGEQGIPVASSRAVRDAYRRLMAIARTNFAELIVEAVRERMVVTGFRTGADQDPTGDAEAWRMWQANGLDADADMVHRAQLSMRAAYVIVGKDPDTGDVVITPEDPRQVYAELDPIRRRRVRAAIKVFYDDHAELDRLYLYLPGEVWSASRQNPGPVLVDDGPVPVTLTAEGWIWDPNTPGTVEVATVPVVPFLNRPDLFSTPVGQFENHIALLDRINYTILSRLEIATLQAFRQRAVKGLPVLDEHGVEIDYEDIFAADPGALWQLPEAAELWESGQVDLGPLRSAIRDDVEHLAAVTRVPVHYLEPVNESAQGVEAKREGLLFLVGDRLKGAGESWEQTMALAFALAGDKARASRPDMEILWADPQRWTLSERADAAAKATAGGLTWRATMERVWQFSPQEIDRMAAERAAETLRAAALAAQLAARSAPVAPGAAAAAEEPTGG